MSEVKYESKIVSSASSIDSIYRVCSDMRHLEKASEMIPKDKVQELECQEDHVRFKVDGLGQKIGFRIVGKEEGDFIKFGLENAPIDGNFWIQLKQSNEGVSCLKLTLKADLPMMFKMMLDKKIQEGLDQAADMMAQFPFDEWAKKA